MLMFICIEILALTTFFVGAKRIKRNFEKELKQYGQANV